MAGTDIAILDYGSGNLRSAQRALERVGAAVTITSDYEQAANANALVVPGVGAFAACMQGLGAVQGPRLIDTRLAGGRAVLGICVGMQVLFTFGLEHGTTTAGCGQWPGSVSKLPAAVLPHMGWNTVNPPSDSVVFSGISDERFYFVHSYAAQEWSLADDGPTSTPLVTWSDYGGPFVSAVENGPLVATQFHPEKSGEAGLALLENWLDSVR